MNGNEQFASMTTRSVENNEGSRRGESPLKQEFDDRNSNKDEESKIGVGIAIGLAIGTGLGMVFGLAWDNLALGISIGVGSGLAIGTAIGTALDQQQK
jgi:hypothetical protein